MEDIDLGTIYGYSIVLKDVPHHRVEEIKKNVTDWFRTRNDAYYQQDQKRLQQEIEALELKNNG